MMLVISAMVLVLSTDLTVSEDIHIEFTKGQQSTLKCENKNGEWIKPFKHVAWQKLPENDNPISIADWRMIDGKEHYTLDEKHKFETVPPDHLSLIFKNVSLSDEGRFMCDVIHAGGKANLRVYFKLSVHSTKQAPETTGANHFTIPGLVPQSTTTVNTTVPGTNKNPASAAENKWYVPVVGSIAAALALGIILFITCRVWRHRRTNAENRRHTNVRYNPIYKMKRLLGTNTGENTPPWRDLDFSQQAWDDMNKHLADAQMPQEVPFLNILVLGRVSHGKSSHINTCNESCRKDKRSGVQELGRLLIGKEEADSESVTRCFRSYTMPNIPLRMYDTRGMGTATNWGTTSDDWLSNIIDGYIKEGFKFDADDLLDNSCWRDSPTLKDKMHCVAVCVDGVQLLMPGDNYTSFIDTLLKIKEIVRAKELKLYILVTKVDKVCVLTSKDTKQALKSKQMLEVLKNVTRTLGVEVNKVYPIRNYVNETRCNLELEILTLSAMKSVKNCAYNYVMSCNNNHSSVE